MRIGGICGLKILFLGEFTELKKKIFWFLGDNASSLCYARRPISAWVVVSGGDDTLSRLASF